MDQLKRTLFIVIFILGLLTLVKVLNKPIILLLLIVFGVLWWKNNMGRPRRR